MQDFSLKDGRVIQVATTTITGVRGTSLYIRDGVESKLINYHQFENM